LWNVESVVDSQERRGHGITLNGMTGENEEFRGRGEGTARKLSVRRFLLSIQAGQWLERDRVFRV
jgi:hypothetical protein